MKETQSIPVRIARITIESWVLSHSLPDVARLPQFGTGRAACFVSLHRNAQLRGCIGTIVPTMESVRSEIVRNAVSACSEDPRFDPVSPDELSDLEISVDILETGEPVSSAAELDPSRYGVIVRSGVKRGLLLPDLEGVDTVEDQLAIACRKAGIVKGERFDIERFTVTRYH